MAIQQFPLPEAAGIPSGNTANRPASPVIGDTYYNGQLEVLEIYNGTNWVTISAPAATPSIVSVTDANTANAYTSTGGTLSVAIQSGVGGSTATQYNVSATPGGHSASSSSTTLSLTGLTPGTAYTVYANAQNNSGVTTNVEYFEQVTPSTLPQVRTIGTATASTTANEITVTWTNGVNGGKPLSAITITPFLNGTTAGTPRTAATTSSTSYTFTTGQLTAGSSYTFKVKATSANGTCADSNASNSATMPDIFSVNYLVVAGAGGGAAGGGGAGGLRSSVTASGRGTSPESTLPLARSTNYTVTVGAGGAGSPAYAGTVGVIGSNSVFSSITSNGGGGGGAGTDGANGGCGGGASYSSGTTQKGLGTTAQGYDGGSDTIDDAPYPGGGGGGTGQIGQNPLNASTGGNGGNGTAVSITGSSVTYGGGGGAGVYGGGTGGTGGTGGGANGQGQNNGTVNLGGGGGGNSNGTTGGNGGSGVVVLRWFTADGSITVGAGLTADATGTDGSYSYKRFTAGSGNVSFA